MAMQTFEKVSYTVIGTAVTVVLAFGAATGEVIRSVRDVFVPSTPMPFTSLSQLSKLQLTGINGLSQQVLGVNFEAREQVMLFVLPARETPATQYLPWLQVQTNEVGQFAQALNTNLPANTPSEYYVSAKGVRGFVAPIGPLHLPKATSALPSPTPENVPVQPTVIVAPALAPLPTAAPKPTNPEPVGEFFVAYYNNRDLNDAPVIARNEPIINANWGAGGPMGAPANNFSVRYYGKFNFPQTENYEFIVLADDGVRLWVNGVLVLNEWRVGPRRELRADVPLTRGEHAIKLEYFDATGSAQVRLSYAVNYSRWEARYYNSPDWTGPVVLKRNDGDADGRLSIDWADRSPAPGINADNFSVSWERVAMLEGGEYKFTLELDDGAKIYIDGVAVWSNLNAVGNHEFIYKLGRGRHTLQVLYAEYGGGAKMKLDCMLLPATPAPIP